MIKVYQTKFGGLEAPNEERGNCLQAALSSILELPIEECFHSWDYSDSEWYNECNKWLSKYGLVMAGFDVTDGKQALLPLLGYHLADTKSTTLKNGESHVVVCYNGEVVHDPNPNATSIGEFQIFWVFHALDPARLRKPMPITGGTDDSARCSNGIKPTKE